MQQALLSTEASSPAEPPEARGSEAGDALLSAVVAVQANLRRLFAHAELFDTQAASDVRSTLDAVESRLGREDLSVVVVGERRSGKSTLLDAIIGDRLLGGARGQISVATFLRRRPVASYRARFASGEVDDFSRRAPDRKLELVRAEDELEQALVDVEQRVSEARAALERAQSACERAALEAQQVLSGAEGAQQRADDKRSELGRAKEEVAELDRSVDELQLAVPENVRQRPPRWALWSWLVFALFMLFRRELWQRYQALLAERALLQARLLARHGEADEARRARQLAEAQLEPLDAGLEQTRSQSLAVEQTLRDSERERERLRGELEVQRSRREHHESERWRQFYADLQGLAQRRDLVELSIDYPARLLPEDVTIVDIPGMVSKSAAEWSIIREQTDGCILVSELDRGVSEHAKQFLRQLREAVPHVLLVLTKMDQAFQAATARRDADPWAQVELARRIGTRRFARELGRDPDSVLSVSVAAEVALSERESELGLRFEQEIAKLFLLLRHERALILGARAAGAIRRCIAGIDAAEERAERTYRERIATLEQQRTPAPAAFREELLQGAVPATEEAAREAIEACSVVVQEGFLLLRRRAEQDVDSCPSINELGEVAQQLERELGSGIADVHEQARIELEAGIERGVSSLEKGLFEAVRQRYQLLHEVRRHASSSPRLDRPSIEPPSLTGVADDIRGAVSAFKRRRYALGASGLVSGAAAGALLHPWLGPVLGGALGGLLSLVRRESTLQGRTLEVLRAALARQQDVCLAQLRSREADVRASISQALERSLERVMVRFGRFIAEPLEAERQAIEAEQQKLSELEQLGQDVRAHDRELERLLEVAAGTSVGLCR